MKWNNYLLLLLSAFLMITACKKKNKMSKVPVLTFNSITREVKAGSSEDTVKIGFQFQDGDADIATDDTTPNLIIANTRDTVVYRYPMPFIPDAYKDPQQGMKGIAVITLEAAFLLLRDTSMTKDSLQFKITLKDNAGNVSNELITPMVYLLK
jgi:hypothetical protein